MIIKYYPRIFERVKAIVIDGLVVFVLMFLVSWIFSVLESVSDRTRISAFVFLFLLYDPIFTSLFGGTIGHMIIGIRVKRDSNEQKNILFPLAILRYIVKAFLGWISLLTITSNIKGKALHDFLVGSVVVYAKSNNDEETNDNSPLIT